MCYGVKFRNILRTEICVICSQRQHYRTEKLYSRVPDKRPPGYFFSKHFPTTPLLLGPPAH